ncbi:MAG: hypothetical protein ACMUIM_09675 [bacterium]
MVQKKVIVILLCLLTLLCFSSRDGLTQIDYNNFNFASSYPFSIYQTYSIYPYSQINMSYFQTNQPVNLQNNFLQNGNQVQFQPYSSAFSFNNMINNLNLVQRTQIGNTSSNPFGSFNMPFMTRFQSNGMFSGTSALSTLNSLFIDPLQPNNLFQGNTSVAAAILPVFSMFTQMGALSFTGQNTQANTSADSASRAKEALTEEVLVMASELIQQMMTLSDHMTSQMEQFQIMAMDIQPDFAESLQEFMQTAMGWSSEGQSFMETMLPMVAEFAEKAMEMGAEFAEKGMEFGFEFATMGEEVGPMANRILFMATQIGVMADRIGEMADRILFMADDIMAFGDKIVYVSQLIVYTEELMVNVTVLINETVRTISDMILTMMAIINDNDTYLQLRADLLSTENQALPLIYENMNLMLDHMLEYSLKLLENEALAMENQIKVRELQLELRESTMSANDCFCPWFCADPNQCFDWTDPNQWLDPNQWFDPNQWG